MLNEAQHATACLTQFTRGGARCRQEYRESTLCARGVARYPPVQSLIGSARNSDGTLVLRRFQYANIESVTLRSFASVLKKA